jgi:hypothetical protein
MTRNETRELLHVSYSRLRIYEQWKWLTPRKANEVLPPGLRNRSGRGRPAVVVYERAEVEAIHARRRLMRSAGVAQRVWAAFRAGRTVVDVVVDLGVEPRVVQELLEQYTTATRCIVLPGDVVQDMQQLGFTVSAETFVTVVRGLLDRVRGKGRTHAVRFLPDTQKGA